MGKLSVGVARVLPFCAVLLVLAQLVGLKLTEALQQADPTSP